MEKATEASLPKAMTLCDLHSTALHSSSCSLTPAPRRPPPLRACSEADRASKFVKLADEAFCIGPPPARESYLRGDVILEVAQRAGVDAIHPGLCVCVWCGVVGGGGECNKRGVTG